MHIERVRGVTPELEDAFARLVPQLTGNNPPPSGEDLAKMLAVSTSVLLVARDREPAGKIVGAGAVAAYRVPTGVRAIIEDLVVDETARGKGVGHALVASLLEAAKEMGAKGVSLTSNPSRAAANRLYVRMGFQLRETNCYYFTFRR